MWPEPAERQCLACAQLLHHRATTRARREVSGRDVTARRGSASPEVTDRERTRRTARPRRDAGEVLPHPSPAEAAAQERSENPYAGRS